MSSNSEIEIASRILDLTARGIDLLAVVTKAATGVETGSALAKEVGRWLGREGLDEHELGFFLKSTQALMVPNGEQPHVRAFTQAITDRKAKASVLPLFVHQSGALGRLVGSDPRQRWLTTVTSCLFRYHDARFIKLALSSIIMLASQAPDSKPLSEAQIAYQPESLRLEPVISKIVDSNEIHIANSGIIGSDSECPQLPPELSWACKRGHNIGSYKLALALNRLRDPPKEIVIRSEKLLTNLVLLLMWHFPGKLRIVVSGSIVYDKSLGNVDSSVEFRVGKFCARTEEVKECRPSDSGPTPSFEMFERIGSDLKSLFSGRYDSQQTLSSEPRARQRLYKSPFWYPPRSQKSLQIQTQRTAQELLRWFCSLPVEQDDVFVGSGICFRLLLDYRSDSPNIRVADLLGRTPQLLNQTCGELGRAFVVFSPPPDRASLSDCDAMDTSDDELDFDADEDMVSTGDLNFEDQPRVLLQYFPILKDLVDSAKGACTCFHCSEKKSQSFVWDENCIRYKVFVEVMFYFSHGIADAFGAPDVSGCSETTAGDSGAMAILFDVISNARFDPRNLEGTLDWHTLLSTTCQVFLGCPPLDKLTDATYNDSTADVPPPYMQHLGATVVAVQHGDLAVVAPWLNLSHKISLKRCLRWEPVKGRLGIPIHQTSGRIVLQEVGRDTSVVETQHTEDVSDYAKMFEMPSHAAGHSIQLRKDETDESCDFFLVSAGETKYKLLMRVTSGSHSRMVDPSRAVIRVARGIHSLRCDHGTNFDGSVPDDHSVELYRFDELLGRWGSLEARTSDPEQESVSSAGASASDPQAGVSSERSEKSVRLLRATHVLNSWFKFNTALATSGDNPLLTADGHCCLDCALRKTIDLKLKGFSKAYGRWILYHDPSHSSNGRLIQRLQLPQPERKLLVQNSTQSDPDVNHPRKSQKRNIDK